MSAGIYEQFGGLKFPTDPTIATSLTPLDPVRAKLTALLVAAINAEFGAAWSRVLTTLPNGHPFNQGAKTPVNDVLEMPPHPELLKQRKELWPLLCVYRTGEGKFDQYTLENVHQLTQKWDVDYILGPLAIGDLRKVSDICVQIAKLMRIVLWNGYYDGYQGGALIFRPPSLDTIGDLGSIEVQGFSGPDVAHINGDPYYAMTVHIETVEHTHEDISTAYGNLEGVDTSIAAGDEDDGIIQNFVMTSTDDLNK